MFVESRKRESDLTNERLAKELKKFREGEQGWFDGTPQSVDRRLAQCDRVLIAARGTVARSPFDWTAHNVITEVEADRRAVAALKDDLLSSGSDRLGAIEAGGDYRLAAHDRRWVTLASKQFVRANMDCERSELGFHELATRARNYAAKETSRSDDSPAITESFVAAVLRHAERDLPQPRPQRTASRDVCEIDAAAMFL